MGQIDTYRQIELVIFYQVIISGNWAIKRANMEAMPLSVPVSVPYNNWPFIS